MNVMMTGLRTVVDFQDDFVRVFTIEYVEDGELSITSPFLDFYYKKTTLRQFLKKLSNNYDIDFGYSDFHDEEGQFIKEFVENYGERFAGGLEAYRNQDLATKIENELYEDLIDGD